MNYFFIIFLSFGFCQQTENHVKIVAGSKKFTESIILGEIITQLVQAKGPLASHKKQLGGTRILWNALLSGEIEIYPDYTGTVMREILSELEITDEDRLRQILFEMGVGISQPIGFNNTYALGIKEETWKKSGVNKISDLKKHPEFIFGFSNEFMNREDGWSGLKEYYQLPQKNVRGLDHDLAYRGLESGDIHLIDLYSTDAEIEYYNLRRLADDKKFFPPYHAIFLYRLDLVDRVPDFLSILEMIEGRISESIMIKLNGRVKLEKKSEKSVAVQFLKSNLGIRVKLDEETKIDVFIQRTKEHLFLSGISLFGAILIAIPLGILATRRKKIGQFILGIAGIIQTIPSLALLVFMIPLLGIGEMPAIAALFLYSLLPIIRNTHTGIMNIPGEMLESADALGLPRLVRLRIIELPMASRSILAGIKTSAVINIGTATLGAVIGAGGYGQPILTGIRLDDVGLILQGAVPAAVLALLVQLIFEGLEKVIIPRGLQIKPENVE